MGHSSSLYSASITARQTQTPPKWPGIREHGGLWQSSSGMRPRPPSTCSIHTASVFSSWGSFSTCFGAQTTLTTGCMDSFLLLGSSWFGRSLATLNLLKRIRDNSGTSGEYIGDSIQNILGDLVSCALGYILGTVFAAVELWWLSIVLVLLIEVGLVLYMRDSLVLMALTFVVRSEKIRNWQICKIPEAAGQKSWKQWMFSSTAKRNC